MDLPYKEFDSQQLNRELQLLNLPGFTGVASRFGEYLRIKCDALPPTQEQTIKDVVAAHVPKPPEPTAQDKAREYLDALALKDNALWTTADIKGAIRALGVLR